ncbi:MAG: hypothetical protein J7493_06080 [Porphyrobacter sp.]|nr:hypothetical protein [Porphyrobacter sp.]
MRSLLLSASVALLFPAIAQAQTCEDTFVKGGNVISGSRFSASATIADLSPKDAIGQLNGIVLSQGYVVIAAEPEDGSLLFEQSMTRNARGFPLTATATAQGSATTVTVEAKLPRGMTASVDTAKSQTCQILGALKGGREGKAAAAKGLVATGTASPIVTTAFDLSHQISKDTERNPAAAELRYQNRSFVLSGNVGELDKFEGDYGVLFDIPNPWEEALQLPNAAPFKTDIICKMAPGQTAFYLQLKPDKSIKLSGDFDSFDSRHHVLVLRNCRSAR